MPWKGVPAGAAAQRADHVLEPARQASAGRVQRVCALLGDLVSCLPACLPACLVSCSCSSSGARRGQGSEGCSGQHRRRAVRTHLLRAGVLPCGLESCPLPAMPVRTGSGWQRRRPSCPHGRPRGSTAARLSSAACLLPSTCVTSVRKCGMVSADVAEDDSHQQVPARVVGPWPAARGQMTSAHIRAWPPPARCSACTDQAPQRPGRSSGTLRL